MPENRITVGDIDIVSLSDGFIGLPIKGFFPNVSDEAWEPYLHQIRADRVLVSNLGSFAFERCRHLACGSRYLGS